AEAETFRLGPPGLTLALAATAGFSAHATHARRNARHHFGANMIQTRTGATIRVGIAGRRIRIAARRGHTKRIFAVARTAVARSREGFEYRVTRWMPVEINVLAFAADK